MPSQQASMEPRSVLTLYIFRIAPEHVVGQIMNGHVPVCRLQGRTCNEVIRKAGQQGFRNICIRHAGKIGDARTSGKRSDLVTLLAMAYAGSAATSFVGPDPQNAGRWAHCLVVPTAEEGPLQIYVNGVETRDDIVRVVRQGAHLARDPEPTIIDMPSSVIDILRIIVLAAPFVATMGGEDTVH